MTFVARPRKRPKKKGACLPVCVRRTGRRGLLFRELPLWCEQAVVPSGRFGGFGAEVLEGPARKSPFNPAAFAWAPLVVVHAVAFVGATLVVAHQARADAVGRHQPAGVVVDT